MLAMLLPILAASAASASSSTSSEFNGRCHYPDAIAEYRHETVLAVCDSLRMEAAAGGASLEFRQKSWGSMLRFEGAMDGQHMTVERIILRTGRSIEANGTCQVFRQDGRVSTVGCVARAGGRSYAANFMVSRL